MGSSAAVRAVVFILIGVNAALGGCASPAELPPAVGDAGTRARDPIDAEASASDRIDAEASASDRDSSLEDAPRSVEPPDLDAAAPEDASLDAGIDCAACRAQSSNRACIENNTACGCRQDRDCAGRERCDLASQRCVPCDGADCWRSELYPADWSPQATSADGRFLHDFSYAGYGAGLTPIPEVGGPTFDITTYGSGPDWRAAIQGAIDAAAAQGGGVVRFPPGIYGVDGRLLIHGSGVVLRGAGISATQVYFSVASGMTDLGHLEIGRAPTYGPRETLLRADAPARAEVVEVEDASRFAPGDQVAVGWVITDAFRGEHQMSEAWGFAAGQWRAFFRRTVLSSDARSPGRLVLDVPLRYPARIRDQASVRSIEGTIHDVGVEDLSLSNAVDAAAAAEESRVSLIAFLGVSDGWVRRVQTFVSPLSGPGAFQVLSHGISVIQSRRVTVEDVSIGRAQNRGSGGNGYLIELSRSNEILVQRATLRDGRHNFSFNWDFGDSGIVIRDSDSAGSACDGALVACRNEFHHALAMAVLIENTRLEDGWVGGNRRSESSGAGHTVTESVYWRLHGSGSLYSWQYGNGDLIGNDLPEQFTELADLSDPTWPLRWLPFWSLSSNGHTSLGTEPEDRVEGAGRRSSLVPASLYLDQLERRRASLPGP